MSGNGADRERVTGVRWTRPATRVGAVVASAVGATVLVVAIDDFRFAYQNEVLKVSLETASALVVALGCYLVAGRFRVRRYRSDGLIAYGLGVLAFSNLLLVWSPDAPDIQAVGLRIATWMPLFCQVIGALCLAIAASGAASERVTNASSRRLAAIAAAPIVGALFVAAYVRLPADTTRRLPLSSALHPQFNREPVVALVYLFTAVVFALAAIGFVARSERHHDRFAEWLAAGCGLSAVARINFALFPSLFSRWLYTGDVIRLAAYVCWLIGAAVEIASYWEGLAASAVTRERSRLARDLHDGLAQELAFVVSQLQSFPPSEGRYSVASAADRALGEARRAIDALADTDDGLDSALRRAVETVALRHQVAIRIDAAAEIDVPIGVREEVVRVGREAVANACRHGHATSIAVSLTESAHEYRLRIHDDGVGFDPDAEISASRFGMRSMRERAEAIGGSLRIDSKPGGGTTIEMIWR